jgi:hypothetical protein
MTDTRKPLYAYFSHNCDLPRSGLLSPKTHYCEVCGSEWERDKYSWVHYGETAAVVGVVMRWPDGSLHYFGEASEHQT